MRFRKLRIAFSATYVIVAVLLVILWARSYSRYYFVSLYRAPTGLVTSTQNGTVAFYTFPYDLNNKIDFGSTVLGTNESRSETYGIRHLHSAGESIVFIHYWLLVAPLAALFVVSWICWRFSLRTLLIATTLVAVVLGLIAWLSNH